MRQNMFWYSLQNFSSTLKKWKGKIEDWEDEERANEFWRDDYERMCRICGDIRKKNRTNKILVVRVWSDKKEGFR